MLHAKRGQRNFPTVIKIHNHAPLSLWYVSIMLWAAHAFHQQAADGLRNNSVFVHVYCFTDEYCFSLTVFLSIMSTQLGLLESFPGKKCTYLGLFVFIILVCM